MSQPLKPIDLERLPADIRASVEALQAQVMAISAANARLEHLVRELRHALYGKRSERLSHDDRQLAFEDLEVAVAEAEEHQTRLKGDAPKKKAGKSRRNLGNLPEDLPRVTKVIEPDSTACPCGCGEMERIGEDRTERLDIVPAQLRVIVTVRPKYACPACKGGVTQAKSPPHLIEGGLPTEGAIAHVLVSKYADHAPLYRQAQMLGRSGLQIDRSTLAGWVGKAAFHLTPIVDRMAEHLKASTKLFMDETTAPVLAPGKGKTKTGYLWALTRDDRPWGGEDPPGVVYLYADGRGGKHAEEFLDGFNGILQTDGYAGYNRLTRNTRSDGALTLAFCWAHGRRKLKEIYDSDGSPIAAEGLRRIAEFYKIEAEIRGLPADRRLAERRARTKPLMDDFGIWLKAQLARVSGKSRLGEKLRYIHSHWDGLQVFLTDGRVEIDSNTVERTIRPIALSRKNALFAGHDEGGRNWGRIASLIETCKMNGVEPFAWLKATLEAIAAGHPASKIDDLMPWAFKPASS
jgi:transposase